MSLTTHSMYQKHILRCLNFSPAALPFGQLWRDPAAAENGFCYIFERPGALYSERGRLPHPPSVFPWLFAATGRRCASAASTKAPLITNWTAAGQDLPRRFIFSFVSRAFAESKAGSAVTTAAASNCALAALSRQSQAPGRTTFPARPASCQCHPKCAPACCRYALARNGGTGRHTNALAAAPGGNGAAMSGRIGRGGGRNLFLTAGPPTHPCPWQAAAVVFGGGPPGHPPGAPSHHRASRSQSHHRLFKPPRSTSMNKN